MLFSSSMSKLENTDSVSVTSMIRDALSFLGKILLALASFLASIGMFILKIAIAGLEMLASIVFNLIDKLVNLFLIPNINNYYDYIPNNTPYHTPLTQLLVDKETYDQCFA